MPVKQHVQETGGQEGGLREDEGGGMVPTPVTLAVLCRSEGSRDSRDRSPSVWSPQGVDVVVFFVLNGVGVPA